MKTIKNFLMVSLCLILTTSCVNNFEKLIKPNGEILEKECSLSNFKTLHASCGFEVFLSMGDTESVIVEAPENLHPYIETIVTNGHLVLRIKDDYCFNIRNTADRPRIYVSALSMESIEASGGSDCKLRNDLKGETFSLALSGGSDFYGNVEAKKIETNLSGGSRFEGNVNAEHLVNVMSGGSTMKMTVKTVKMEDILSGGSVNKPSGVAENYSMDASGGSEVEGFDLFTENVNADLSGSSRLEITVNKTLNVSASGGSTVYYKGNAAVQTNNLSGGASIKHQD